MEVVVRQGRAEGRRRHMVALAVAAVALAAACADGTAAGTATTAGSTSAAATTTTAVPAGGIAAGTSATTGATGTGVAGTPAVAGTSIGAPTPRPGAMPPVVVAGNVYSETAVGKPSPAPLGTRPLVYVPDDTDGTVRTIDPATYTVVGTYKVGSLVQHVVPGWDSQTLYANASASNALVPFDPRTGQPGAPIPVSRPYNLYWAPDGSKAIVMNEQNNAIDYYDRTTWKLLRSVPSTCNGNNHADWSADGTYFLVTCEFSGDLLKVDTATGDVMAKLNLGKGSMPQDVRLLPRGDRFYVADMMGPVWVVDGLGLKVLGSIKGLKSAHGIYPSRDGSVMYVTDRGRHEGDTKRKSRPGEGGVALIDPASDRVLTTWQFPKGGSPDMGGLTADGRELWLSGRYDGVVYVFDTATGSLTHTIPVGPEPHGLAVFPQPGRYNLGHTGNYR